MRILSIAVILATMMSSPVYARNQYPTDEVVRYVVGCMAELGGQKEENLYSCVCRIESLMDQLTYEEYDGANLMERNKQMPGKKGGFFRDNDYGAALYEKLVAARETAFASCPVVKKVEVKRATKAE